MENKTFKRIILFASGSGTNVENIVRYFQHNSRLEIAMVFTNNPNAGVIDRISSKKIPVTIFEKNQLTDGFLLNQIQLLNPDLIVLAGFMLKIPPDFTQIFSNKIINIHPSLLPKHGGKDMYGKRVHEAVLSQGDSESGITVHLVNEEYDKGEILAQFSCAVDSSMLIDDLAKKIQDLEHTYYKSTIEKFILHV